MNQYQEQYACFLSICNLHSALSYMCIIFKIRKKCDLFQSPSLPGGGRWMPAGNGCLQENLPHVQVPGVRAACMRRGGNEDREHNSLPQQPLYSTGSFLNKVCMAPSVATSPPWTSPELLLLAKPATQPASHRVWMQDFVQMMYLQTSPHRYHLNPLRS